MKELNDEIKLTLNLMQTDIDDGAHSELQTHLYNLLEMKRDEIRQRLTGSHAEPAKPLTVDELRAGGWWCADVSKECADAFKSKGLKVYNSHEWSDDGVWIRCGMDSEGYVSRGYCPIRGGNKQIHRIGNNFYWSKK